MSTNYDFAYLIEKIDKIDFEISPFKHVYIENFFSDEHFNEIQCTKEIAAPQAKNDEELISGLIKKGFKPIPFPGCVTDVKKYIKWHSRSSREEYHSACEGFGMALRLYKLESPILVALNEFLIGDKFNKAIAKKFDVTFTDCVIDGGIQKYLDGYEISPHADIRKKAATFMVNINPNDQSELLNHHTHYMRLNPSKSYIKSFWEGNVDIDREWVPWTWAETVKQQTKNNSIVCFSPSNDTLHAVKADYDHLLTQRTQLYGNLWYKESSITDTASWESLDLVSNIRTKNKIQLKKEAVKLLPDSVKTIIKKITRRENEIGKRNLD